MAGGFSDSWMTSPEGTSSSRRRKGPFEDLVEERRQRGDLGWVLRTRSPTPRPAFGSAPASGSSKSPPAKAAASATKSPADVKREVLSSDRLLYGLREICLETGRPMEELLAEADAILVEMSHNLSMFAVRSFGFAVMKVMKRLYRGVYVNTEGISQLRKACSEYPVVLMPMHRSYADFLLLSLICYDQDLPLPAIASAMDFMGMKFIGTVLRNCGAFFIRRSFATDRVYWLTFVEYVKTHVRDGLHPVEFFLEGTRSRSGKSLYPKTGMLGAILESWFMCEVPDIYLVPVSISYDRILEERLYAYELLGVPKPKESTSGLFKARALLSEDFGNVHFHFDEPISLRKFAEMHGGVDRSVHSLAPKVKAQLTEAETKMLKAAAHHVVVRHQANAIISPFCLMAALLLEPECHNAAKPLTMNQLAADLAWLRLQLVGLGAIIDWPTDSAAGCPRAVIRDQCGSLHGDLVNIRTQTGVEGDGGHGDEGTCLVALAPAESSADLVASAAMGLRLCSYRNHLMCHLALPALILASATASQSEPAAVVFSTLSGLLHREFPTLPESLPKSTTTTTTQFKTSSVDERWNKFLAACLRPFLVGCRLVCEILLERPSLVTSSERQIAVASQACALARMSSSSSCCWDCLSLDLLTNVVHGLRRLRILQRKGAEGCDWAALRRLTDLLESLIGHQPVATRPKL